jgi:hypothetical protein
MPRSPKQICASNICSTKLEGVSNTAANPANPRPHADELCVAAESVNTGAEDLLFAALASEMNVPLDADAVTGWIGRLTAFDRDVSDAERVDQLRALERLKAAAAAAQARISVDLDASVRAADAAHGLPADRRGRGVAGQIAFARQESPYRGRQHLGLGKTLVSEMPHTLAALEQGLLSEWRATLLARETACLSVEHAGSSTPNCAPTPPSSKAGVTGG